MNPNPDLKTMLLAVEATHATGKVSSTPTASEIAEAFYATKRALVHALNGAKLRGLPNLGTATAPYWGLNLSCAGFTRTISFPDRRSNEGPWTLTINADGHLAAVRSERIPGGEKLIAAQASGDWFTFVENTEPAHVKSLLSGRSLREMMAVLPRVLNSHLDLMRTSQDEDVIAVADAKAFVTGLEGGGRR